jgi:putative alpha-1,2-mannosidase
MDQLYKPQPDGLCGDEDNGQTSAWYVLSAMGFYSVCPGVPQYVIGSPLFDKVTMTLENGNSFEIVVHENNPDHVYIQKSMLNGSPHDIPWISHENITQGGKLEFFMGEKPNKQWGAAPEDAPYSMGTAIK